MSSTRCRNLERLIGIASLLKDLFLLSLVQSLRRSSAEFIRLGGRSKSGALALSPPDGGHPNAEMGTVKHSFTME